MFRYLFRHCSVCVLIACGLLSCTKPVDDNNAPVQSKISTVIKLSVDPPSQTKYDPNVKPKIIATVVPERTGGEAGGTVVFTINQQPVCGTGMTVDSNWQAICVPDHIGGGQNTIKAYYTGSIGYKASEPTELKYQLTQFPIKDINLILPEKSPYTIGDKINISATLTKDQESDPDFEKKYLLFSITNQIPHFFGLFHTTNIHNIPADCTHTDPTKDGLKTTITCEYTIMPDDFIEGAGSEKDTPYDVTFDVQYKGDDNYENSAIRSSELTQIQKILPKITTIQSKCTGSTDNNIYMNGNTVCFTATAQRDSKIPFQNPMSLYLKDGGGNNVGKSTQAGCTPSKSVQDSWECQYLIVLGDVTDQNRYFAAQYLGDRAYNPSKFEATNSQSVNKITDGHMLGAFTLDSFNPSTVQMGDIVILSGTIQPEQNGTYIDAKNLKILLSNGSINQSYQLQNCSAPNTGGQYSNCTYQITSADLDQKYNTIQAEYHDTTYKKQSTNPPQNITITKRTLDGSFSIKDPSTDYYVGQEVTFQFSLNKALPNNIEPNIGVQSNSEKKSATQQCNVDTDRKTFTCSYQMQVSDADSKTPTFTLCFLDASSCKTNDNNYQWNESNTPPSVQLPNIRRNEPEGELSYTIQNTGYPVKVMFTMQMKRKNNQPYNGTIQFYQNNSPIKTCTVSNTSDSCDVQIQYGDADYANNNEYSAKYTPIDTKQDSYNSSTTPIDSKTIQPQSCTVSIESQQSIDYTICSAQDGCTLKPVFYCFGQTTPATFSTGTLAPDTTIERNNGIALPKSTVNPVIKMTGTYEFQFVPVSENVKISKVKMLNGNNVIATIDDFNIAFDLTKINKSNTTTQCGQFGNITQRIFDCYARTQTFAGIGPRDGQQSGKYMPDPGETADPKTWYLVSCPDAIKDHCSWLTPEILFNTFEKTNWKGYAARQTNFSQNRTDGRPNPTSVENLMRIELKPGDRLLWSGEIEVVDKNTPNPSAVTFVDINGLGQLPRCGSTDPLSIASKTPLVNYIKDSECTGSNAWDYYTNLGGYDMYACQETDPRVCINQYGGDPYKPESGRDHSWGISLNQQYALIQKLPTCTGNTTDAGKDTSSIDPFHCAGYGITDRTGMMPKLNWIWTQTKAKMPMSTPKNIQDAYKDLCQRYTDDKDHTDRIIKNGNSVPHWHVPSYSEILLLTGASDWCNKNNGSWFRGTHYMYAYCLLGNGGVLGFLAADPLVPGFNKEHWFYSSSVILTSDFGWDNSRAWTYAPGGDVLPRNLAAEALYDYHIEKPEDPTKIIENEVLRCVSTDW